jgi:hypothetical protein
VLIARIVVALYWMGRHSTSLLTASTVSAYGNVCLSLLRLLSATFTYLLFQCCDLLLCLLLLLLNRSLQPLVIRSYRGLQILVILILLVYEILQVLCGLS